MAAADILPSSSLVRSLRSNGLLDTSPEEAFDQYTRLVAQLLEVPFVAVSLIDGTKLYVKSSVGLPDDVPRVWPIARENQLVLEGQTVTVPDIREHPVLAERSVLARMGMTALMIVPICLPQMGLVGVICVMNDEPHAWTKTEAEQTRTVARAVASELAVRVKVWERAQVQEQLRESEARLRLATAAAGVGIFETDLVEGKLYWSDQTCAIYGVPPGTVVDIDDFETFIPPEDWAEMEKELANSVDPASGDRFDFQHRIITPAGEERYVEMRSEVVFEEQDGEQRAVRILGTVIDTTKSHRREETLRERTARLELAIQASDMGTWDYDLAKDRVVWSRQGERIFGLEPGTFDGTVEHYYSLVHPDDLPAVRNSVEGGYDPEQGPLDLSYRIIWPDNSVRWVRSIGRLYYDKNGKPRRMIGTVVDVTDRHVYEQGLREAKERAEEMSRLKTAFLANMSHEIRTPLTSIIGFSEVLADDFAEEGSEMVDMIRMSGQRLLSTLNSVLDLAQLDAGTLQLTPEPDDLGVLAGESADMMAAQFREKGLTLNVRTHGVVGASVDKRAFHRVVTNLLTNALKFTPSGHVDVEVEEDGGWALLRVRDTGIGIDEAFMPYLFDEFRQESTGHTRTHEGNGLGLSITRQLVQLMGGEIDASSVKGEGTTFTVRLPCCELSNAPEPVKAPDHVVSIESRPTVLVVEDHPDTRQLLKRMLSPLTDVILTSGYADALSAAQRQHVDAAIIDIQLGTAESGIDVMRALRSMPSHADTPLVACTAHALPGDQHRMVQHGFDAYVAKPFRRETLLDVLRAQLIRPTSSAQEEQA